jgi:hypothetical protein
VTLQSGDIFLIPIAKNESLFGRVLLDTFEQCVRPKRVLSSSPLSFFCSADAHLVEVSADDASTQVVIPSAFTYAVDQDPIGHRPVDATTVDFPWTLSLYGPRPHLYWGELRIPVALSIPEYRSMEVSPGVSPVRSLVPRSLYRLGRQEQIDQREYPDSESYSPGRQDLRASLYADRIRELVADRMYEDYYTTALAYGYDLRRLYDPDAGGRELVLCAYCCATLPETAAHCGVCTQPTGNDAPFSVTVDELAFEGRTACQGCRAPLYKNAVICRWCMSRQSSR